jgi:putative transposase
MDEPKDMKNLPRLNREAYRGFATAHWVFNMKDRRTGWLNERFFLRFQMVALHAFSRYRIASPAICVMPDHIHLILMGYTESSDQTLAVSFLRKHLKVYLVPFEFQKTPYDHVLRNEERKRKSFAQMVGYVRKNPVRAGLVKSDESWDYECCLVPGYPDLSLHQANFWDKYWKIFYALVEKMNH